MALGVGYGPPVAADESGHPARQLQTEPGAVAGHTGSSSTTATFPRINRSPPRLPTAPNTDPRRGAGAAALAVAFLSPSALQSGYYKLLQKRGLRPAGPSDGKQVARAATVAGPPVAIYARISLDKEQDARGVARQIDVAVERIYAEPTWRLPAPPFVDNDMSASKGLPRPEYAGSWPPWAVVRHGCWS
jgi:hypothetical protein